MKQILSFLFISITVVSVYCIGDVPVLILGPGVSSVKDIPALHKLSSDSFHDFLKQVTSYNPSAIVAFLEDTISNEDYRWRDTSGKGSFPNIQEFSKSQAKKYIASVENPFKSLMKLENQGFDVRNYDEKELLNESSPTVLIVNLDDAKVDEDRPRMLRRHDQHIHDICKKMQNELGDVLCLLTAYRNSYIEPEVSFSARKLLQADETPSATPSLSPLNLYWESSFGMVYTKSPPIVTDLSTNTSVPLYPTTDATKSDNTAKSQKLVASLKGNNTKAVLRFVFTVKGEVWSITDLQVLFNSVEYVLTTNTTISASIGMSYHTPFPVVFRSGNSTIIVTFNGLQAEYFSGIQKSSFSVAEDAVYFFTIPIITGISVSTLLLTIVFWGLSMIIDIKTMDRFDDPKGKTITISTTD